MIGRALAHYRVTAAIGAGGMGEVYRAVDSKLGREVALKVLPAEVASDPERLDRFRREAQALAALDHPGIVTVFSVEEADGIHFLTMQLVEGASLDQLIPEGGMPEAQLLDVATQLAAALEAAHAKGVVHRDLKPGNVMVTPSGRVEILDFGLAKMLAAPTGETAEADLSTLAMTRAGLVLGTMPYMAPEQAAGRAVDARSDLFSLGVMLYEMATGRRPFRNTDPSQLIAAILTESPAKPREVKGEVSPGLEAVILKLLEKDPEQRYQSAAELGTDLEHLRETGALAGSSRRSGARWLKPAIVGGASMLVLALLFALDVGGLRQRLLGGAASPGIRSLAVLPLENLSGDPSQQFLADGMTEELIASVAKIKSLRVISRTSVMRYRRTQKALPQIARELGVDAIIEGSVTKAGNRLRVIAELIDGKTDQHLWEQSYERDVADVLALQNEVARAIAGAIAVKLSPQERTRLTQAKRVNPAAYEAYLKGRAEWEKLTPDSLAAALNDFQHALEKDPDYAPAYAGIAAYWGARQQFSLTPPSEATPRQKAAILKALELDPDLSDAHTTLANIAAWNDWDWERAETEFKRAIDLDPSDTWARGFYSHLLNVLGRPDEATTQIQRALELDPFNPLLHVLHAVDLVFVRKYGAAEKELRKVRAAVPNNRVGSLPAILVLEGKKEEALKEIMDAAKQRGDTELMTALEHGSHDGGFNAAMHAAAETLARRGKTRFINKMQVATLYTLSGDEDAAIKWLQEALEDRNPNMPYLLLPVYDDLRGDSRFQEIMRSLNLPVSISQWKQRREAGERANAPERPSG